MKRRNKIVQEITRNGANVFIFYAIIGSNMVFQLNIGIDHSFLCITIHQIPREVLKTAASGLGFQHLPWDLANGYA